MKVAVLLLAALLSGCSVIKGNILESDATIVGINIQAVEWGSLTLGYRSGRIVSVPLNECDEVPSIKSEKKVSSGVTGAEVTDTLNIGGME